MTTEYHGMRTHRDLPEISAIFIFTNGQVAVFDPVGQQIPELQIGYDAALPLLISRIVSQAKLPEIRHESH